MPFFAVTDITPEGRIAKYQVFATRAKAQAFIDTHLDNFPAGQVVANPTARPYSDVLINPTSRATSFSPPAPPEPGKGEGKWVKAIRLLAQDASPGTKAQVLALLG